MAEPAKRVDLRAVDENFQADQAAPAGDKLKAQLAAAVREGRRRERADQLEANAKREGQHAGQIEGINQAHAGELTRAHTLIGKAAHRDGLFHGVLIGSALVVALALGAFVILKETVILNTATQRVNYPNPPVLVDQYQEPDYERHPREPGQ